jgi:hypothetical protein
MKRDIKSKIKMYLVNDGWGTRYKVAAEDLDGALNKFDQYYSKERGWDIIGTEIDKLYTTTVITYEISPLSSRTQRGKEVFYIFEEKTDIFIRNPEIL